ncbi:MAG TPA: hypothetical protein VI564_01995 [Candidatus Nanoarchaeia archaeon]|nr:hypothetical protein [Candidatus Nanoarchaeia archaeon]
MPKTKITKDRVSITLDKSLLKELEGECLKRTMKLSSYIEKLIRIGKKHEK